MAAQRVARGAPPAARGKKITRSASRGTSSKLLTSSASRRPPGVCGRHGRPHARVELAAERLDQLPLLLGHLDVALGEHDLTMTGLHPQELHRLSIMANAMGADRQSAPRIRCEARARRPGRRPRRGRAARARPPRPRARARCARPAAACCPSASCAASTEECVQPEPCAAPSGWRSPSISTAAPSPAASRNRSTARARWPPGEHDRARAEREHRPGERTPLRRPRPPVASRSRPASTRASGRFGVSTLARGRICSTSARWASGVEQPRAGLGDHHRVDHHGRARAAARRAPRRPRASTSAVPSMPTLTASTPMSDEHRAHLREDDLRRHGWIGADADRVLGGDRRDRARAVHAAARERLQVGLDAGAAAGVRAGDRQRGAASACSPWR